MLKKVIYYLGLCGLLVMMLSTRVIAQDQPAGIINQPAPPFEVTEWMNLPEGHTTFDITDVKGKVVYLYFFQTW